MGPALDRRDAARHHPCHSEPRRAGPVFALALEVVRSGPFRIARFMGGRHAEPQFFRSGPDLAKDGRHQRCSNPARRDR